MKTIIKILLASLPLFGAFAQTEIPVGTWRTHYSYEQMHQVLQTSAKIFAASSQGMLSFDPEDNSLTKLNKVNELSDATISAMAYDGGQDRLLLGYETGNIDLITVEGVFNIPDLFNSSSTANKRINHISFYQDNAYLSTDFGLLVVDLIEVDISDVFQNLGETGDLISIHQSSIWNEEIYLASSAGTLRGELSPSINLQDFNNWHHFKDSVVLQKNIPLIAAVENTVYAATEHQVFGGDGQSWDSLDFVLNLGELILNLKPSLNGVYVITNLAVYEVNPLGEISIQNFDVESQINDVIQVSTNEYWLATEAEGLVHYQDGHLASYLLNGPSGTGFHKVKMQGDDLVLFPSLETNISGALGNRFGYSSFSEGKWTTHHPEDIGGLSNVSDVLVSNDKMLFTSFGNGVYDANQATTFDETNSLLETTDDAGDQVLVTGVVEDRNQNTWIAAYGDYSLFKIDSDGLWERFRFGFGAAERPNSMQINGSNQLWMTLGANGEEGILAYDIEEDKSRFITSSAGLPANQVNDIAFGNDGEVWIATAQGIVYFPFSYGIIEDSQIGVIQPVFEGDYLFNEKNVTAVAIDGGNRKWIGGQDGVWLFDENIETAIFHFTEANSPLPSNSVVDIAIDPEIGEVFIVTDNGILSYRADATQGSIVHQDVAIFPNPVRHNYTGLVGFSGLVNDGNLKITTVSGRLVREINANGGAASWDVADYKGRRVTTGVYMVYSSNDDGTETYVGKIAVLN